MTPGAAFITARCRPTKSPRKRKPLTQAELRKLFARIKKRVVAGGKPFGVFAIKVGGGRQFKLLSVSSEEYKAQLRLDEAFKHCLAIAYDGRANLGDVWEDLCAFDQVPAA